MPKKTNILFDSALLQQVSKGFGAFADFTDHDARERRGHGLELFHLQAAHGEGVGQLLGGQRRITELSQPGLGKLHGRVFFLGAG